MNSTPVHPLQVPQNTQGGVQPRSPEDWREIARLILDGEPEATRWFFEKVRPDVAAFVASQCWNSHSRRLANEIVDDVFAECFGGYPGQASDRQPRPRPLLLKFRGKASLPTWLKQVARNRLLTRVKSKEERSRVFPLEEDDSNEFFERLEHASESRTEAAVGAGEPAEGAAGENLLRFALRSAVESLQKSDPDVLVMLELHFLRGVPQSRLARAWQVEPSTVGRRMKRVLKQLGKKTRETISREQGKRQARWRPRYTVEDFLEVGCGFTLGSLGANEQANESPDSATLIENHE